MASNPRVFKHPIPGTPAATAASSDIKMITAEELCESVVPKNEVVQIPLAGKLLLSVRTMISMKESIKFTEMVLQLCWGEDYEVMDFAFRCAVIAYYSNVQLPEGLDKKYEMVYGTNLYDTVMQYANRDQTEALYQAVKMYLDR